MRLLWLPDDVAPLPYFVNLCLAAVEDLRRCAAEEIAPGDERARFLNANATLDVLRRLDAATNGTGSFSTSVAFVILEDAHQTLGRGPNELAVASGWLSAGSAHEAVIEIAAADFALAWGRYYEDEIPYNVRDLVEYLPAWEAGRDNVRRRPPFDGNALRTLMDLELSALGEVPALDLVAAWQSNPNFAPAERDGLTLTDIDSHPRIKAAPPPLRLAEPSPIEDFQTDEDYAQSQASSSDEDGRPCLPWGDESAEASACQVSDDCPSLPTAEPSTLPDTWHSEDFTAVRWFGTHYDFKVGHQARIVQLLWDEWKNGGGSLGLETIRNKLEAGENFTLRHTFRGHPAYGQGKMICATSKGVYKLRPPGSP